MVGGGGAHSPMFSNDSKRNFRQISGWEPNGIEWWIAKGTIQKSQSEVQ